jgi:hypothetical protein
MEVKRDRAVIRHSLLLLILKVLLGAAAAVAGMLVMRVVGSREVIVALFIGLVPGVVEKSPKKIVYGAVFACIGYFVGARVGTALAKNIIQEVPIGHWGIVGGFIGLTAGISRTKGQWFSFRFILWSLGAVYGFLFGLILGLFGDIGGYMLIPFGEALGLHYYTREISLLFAGIFINLGVAIAGIFMNSLDNGLWRVARAVEKTEA